MTMKNVLYDKGKKILYDLYGVYLEYYLDIIRDYTNRVIFIMFNGLPTAMYFYTTNSGYRFYLYGGKSLSQLYELFACTLQHK